MFKVKINSIYCSLSCFIRVIADLFVDIALIFSIVLLIVVLCNPFGYFYKVEITSNNYPVKYTYKSQCIDGLLFTGYNLGANKSISQIQGMDGNPVLCRIWDRFNFRINQEQL